MDTASIPISTPHVFHFDAQGLVSPRALAESLLGLEGVITSSKQVISCLLGTAYVTEIDVRITKIEIGSYKDSFVVRLVLGRGKALERNIEKIRKTLKLSQMEPGKVIGIALTAVIVYVAYLWAKPEDPARIQIENSFNQVGSAANLTGEELRTLVDAVLSPGKRSELSRQTSRLLHPQGSRNTGTVRVDDDPLLMVPQEVIKQIPPASLEEPDEDIIESLPNAQMVVRAADLDSATKGWWGIIPGVSERRVHLNLLPTVDPAKVPIGKYFQCDVTVTFRIDAQGARRPRHYFVSRIHDDPGLAGPVAQPEP